MRRFPFQSQGPSFGPYRESTGTRWGEEKRARRSTKKIEYVCIYIYILHHYTYVQIIIYLYTHDFVYFYKYHCMYVYLYIYI